MRYVLAFLCLALAGPASAQPLTNAFPNLTFDAPVDIQSADDGSNRLFVVEQQGTIRVFTNDAAVGSASVFLNITGRVLSGGEQGLLGLVFDPDYAQNGYFYVNYTASGPRRTVISRFEVTSNPNVADAGSEEVLITVDQPFSNHNAGQVQFGPDGYLYVALGDGGSGGDPLDSGQSLDTLLGSLLRLDVDGGGNPLDCGAGTGSATIPADNPFIDGPGGDCDEAWAYGLRNPFRYSFGPEGRLWLADVGQNRREEVNIMEAGGNYGWNDLEGTLCYPSGQANCPLGGTIPPIFEHPHNFFGNQGAFSIIGGYVYTGPSCEALRGKYVYGDFITRNLWTLTFDGVTADNDELSASAGPTTFGLDEQGDLFLTDGNLIERFDCATDVAVEASLVGGPVTIPSGGGSFSFDVTLDNTTGAAQTVDVWVSADLSNGTERNRVFGPQTVTLPGGASGTGRVTLSVPGQAPAGVSTGVVTVGDFPNGPTDAARFTITKLGGALGDRVAADAAWQVEGANFGVDEARVATASATADGFALAAFPTPFAEQTTVQYTLDASGPVRLAVYDVLGREVAVLADGQAEAGTHEAVFEAAGLPSGVYLLQLDAGRRAAVQTVTLTR
ncbi:MAG: PQQ-dependent sugar dehydrogenase [Bacteroidota bacterium]